jgi:hypothetical protein
MGGERLPELHNGLGTYGGELEDEFGAVAIDVEPLVVDDSSTTKDDDD